MISTINGTLRSIGNDRIVVEVGGVGLSVLVNASTSASMSMGAQVLLFTSLVVREDSLTLFGFLTDEERSLFELVQTVSGIGPKVALSILNALSPEDLGRAISSDDVAAIERVPGIGHKGAQRMILELKGKLTHFSTSAPFRGHIPMWRENLIAALISLGFAPKEADLAISELVSLLMNQGRDPKDISLSELLKDALANSRSQRG